MKVWNNFSGVVAPLDRSNVDTDAIIPKQYLKSIKRSGFGPYLFDEWRYLDKGELGIDNSKRREAPDFLLNQPQYRQANILLVRENFGCGSSREHAVWSLMDHGINAIIGSSFADIFYSNAFKNGLLLITLDSDVIDRLFQAAFATTAYQLGIDLQALKLSTPTGEDIVFSLPADLQHRLLYGLDDIAVTLESADKIKAYEDQKRQQSPWLFVTGS